MPEKDGNLMKSACARKLRTVSRAPHRLYHETIASFLAKWLRKTLSQNGARTGVQFRS
jgi:hypothetical protein